MKKKAVIIGAGPAGLTAAYELLKNTDVQPIVFESSDMIGGISRTVNYKGNRMDIGGHRFFSKNERVTDFWDEIMPLQGAPAYDDKILGKNKQLNAGGPNPETDDKVMLVRERVSRIFYLRKFFDYPISLKWETFANMGVVRTMQAAFGYLYSVVFKRKEKSLEDFYINRFGKPLYKMFFEDYTQKVWGVHPSKLGADWGTQRVKGLSVLVILRELLKKTFGKGNDPKKGETSLIEQFVYPKFGPGQLWETVAEKIEGMGGEIVMNAPVKSIILENGTAVAVEVLKDGKTERIACDYLFSSMPIKDLIPSIIGAEVPQKIKETAETLPYRDFITVGLLINKLSIRNLTKIKTYNQRIPDTWVYIQERDVKIGRLQVFNNWSPYMVADYNNTMFIGLEYFCTEGDEMWNMPQDTFVDMAIAELEKIDLLKKEDVLDATQVKMKKAYPAYFGSYYQLPEVISYLDTIENLYCIGRNGQHRYNNMDHSMLTAMEAVDNIKNGIKTKHNIWNVNTEEEYHETK